MIQKMKIDKLELLIFEKQCYANEKANHSLVENIFQSHI